MKFLSILILSLLPLFSHAQTSGGLIRKVLFLGNSYTAVNNLPQVTHDVTASVGDSLYFDSNTPGGYTFQMHSVDATSLAKIQAGNWDFVALQEQSQLPSFPISQVMTDCFPYAHYLDSLVHASSPCGRSVFYMTWGRKNGDVDNCPTWPPVCTYSGMDSLLRLRYMMMAADNHALVSPVGAVRHYIRDHYPAIELYQSDDSHPTEAGTYAAACCFYTVLFRKDPGLISYDYTLSPTDAASIRSAVKIVAYDSLMTWHVGEYDPAGIIDHKEQTDFSLEPNPASEYLRVFSEKFAAGSYQLEVYNAAGKLLISNTTLNSNSQVIDISSLKTGIYLLRISDQKKLCFTKIFLKLP